MPNLIDAKPTAAMATTQAQAWADMPLLAANEALRASLPPPVASSLISKTESSLDPERTGELAGYSLRPGVWGAADMAEARETMRQAMTPAPAKPIIIELSKLWNLTARRASDQTDLKIMLGAFTEAVQFEAYPLDVVIRACRFCRELSEWFPTWKAFREQAEAAFADRRAIARALQVADSRGDVVRLQR